MNDSISIGWNAPPHKPRKGNIQVFLSLMDQLNDQDPSFYSQILWWYIFVGSFFVSMSLFLSLISKEEGPKERKILSFASGCICILTFLIGMYFGFV